MIQSRLVGDVEEGILQHAFFCQKIQHGRKQLLQKCLIGFALRGRMPAEQMLFSAVHTDVDVRRGGHAPLGIEVRDLEAANAVFVREIDVARGPREIESIAFTVLFDLDELHAEALSADQRIE